MTSCMGSAPTQKQAKTAKAGDQLYVLFSIHVFHLFLDYFDVHLQ